MCSVAQTTVCTWVRLQTWRRASSVTARDAEVATSLSAVRFVSFTLRSTPRSKALSGASDRSSAGLNRRKSFWYGARAQRCRAAAGGHASTRHGRGPTGWPSDAATRLFQLACLASGEKTGSTSAIQTSCDALNRISYGRSAKATSCQQRQRRDTDGHERRTSSAGFVLKQGA